MWSSRSPEHGKYDERRELWSGQEPTNGTADSWSSFRCKTCRPYKTDTVREIPTFVGHSLAHEEGPRESSARSLPCSLCRSNQKMGVMGIMGIPKIWRILDWITEFISNKKHNLSNPSRNKHFKTIPFPQLFALPRSCAISPHPFAAAPKTFRGRTSHSFYTFPLRSTPFPLPLHASSFTNNSSKQGTENGSNVCSASGSNGQHTLHDFGWTTKGLFSKWCLSKETFWSIRG